MDPIIIRLICLAIGYAIGCLQFAYIIGKLIFKTDIREHGSGNSGASNMLRTLGKGAGFTVFTLDVLKALAAFIICALIFGGGGSFFESGLPLHPGLYGGLGALLGHNFPFYLKFRGGKGIASSLGIMLAIDWRAAIIVYLVGAVLLALTRYISLTSMVMAVLFPVLLLLLLHMPETFVIATLMAALAVFLHRGNIQRLLTGTERKLVL